MQGLIPNAAAAAILILLAAPDLEADLPRAERHLERQRWSDPAESHRSIVATDPEPGRAWLRLGYAEHVPGHDEDASAANGPATTFGGLPSTALHDFACAHALLVMIRLVPR
ncbi:MAG: hypothetical protein AAF726_03935 [Planctomycetota bacterium]